VSDSIYSDKLRVRVAGLLVEKGKLLLVKLSSPISKRDIWTPPGGGVEFGESIHIALKREFKEETGLGIKIGELAQINELIEDQFHVLEFFFWVAKIDGSLKLGFDPEHNSDDQLLKDLEFVSYTEVKKREVKPDILKSNFWINKSSRNIIQSFKESEN
tara:strand:+ start:47125 stop:47601 length:477 start_codon:yes stop_codon:yes gene_type:complete